MPLRSIEREAERFQRSQSVHGQRELIPPIAMFARALVDANGNVILNAANAGIVRNSESVPSEAGATALMNRQTVSIANYAEVEISKGEILNDIYNGGIEIVPAPGPGLAIELITMVLMFKFDPTADGAPVAYGGGGAITLEWGGSGAGAPATGAIAAAFSFGSAVDIVMQAESLNPSGGKQLFPETASLSLQAATGVFTDGTGHANGIGRCIVTYRIHEVL